MRDLSNFFVLDHAYVLALPPNLYLLKRKSIEPILFCLWSSSSFDNVFFLSRWQLDTRQSGKNKIPAYRKYPWHKYFLKKTTVLAYFRIVFSYYVLLLTLLTAYTDNKDICSFALCSVMNTSYLDFLFHGLMNDA